MTPYTPIRSSFELIDAPLHYLHSNQSTNSPVKNFLNYAGAVIVTPIALCAIPVTITADIVVGIAESALLFCRGYSWQAIGEVAKKKIVVSPLHQLTLLSITLGSGAAYAIYVTNICYLMLPSLSVCFNYSWKLMASVTIAPFIWMFSNPIVEDKHTATSIKKSLFLSFIHNKMVFTAANLGAIVSAYLLHQQFLSVEISPKASIILLVSCTALTALYSYRFSQRFIGSLSNSWNHQNFNIFYNGGTADENGLNYLDEGFRGMSLEDWIENNYQKYSSKRQTQNWKAFLEQSPSKIGTLKHNNPLYTEFRNKVLARKSPSELLGLGAKPTAEEIKKAFRKYSLVIHPDRNRDRTEESTALFQCLQEARAQLEGELEFEPESSTCTQENTSSSSDLVVVQENACPH